MYFSSKYKKFKITQRFVLLLGILTIFNSTYCQGIQPAFIFDEKLIRINFEETNSVDSFINNYNILCNKKDQITKEELIASNLINYIKSNTNTQIDSLLYNFINNYLPNINTLRISCSIPIQINYKDLKIVNNLTELIFDYPALNEYPESFLIPQNDFEKVFNINSLKELHIESYPSNNLPTWIEQAKNLDNFSIDYLHYPMHEHLKMKKINIDYLYFYNSESSYFFQTESAKIWTAITNKNKVSLETKNTYLPEIKNNKNKSKLYYSTYLAASGNMEKNHLNGEWIYYSCYLNEEYYLQYYPIYSWNRHKKYSSARDINTIEYYSKRKADSIFIKLYTSYKEQEKYQYAWGLYKTYTTDSTLYKDLINFYNTSKQKKVDKICNKTYIKYKDTINLKCDTCLTVIYNNDKVKSLTFHNAFTESRQNFTSYHFLSDSVIYFEENSYSSMSTFWCIKDHDCIFRISPTYIDPKIYNFTFSNITYKIQSTEDCNFSFVQLLKNNLPIGYIYCTESYYLEWDKDENLKKFYSITALNKESFIISSEYFNIYTKLQTITK